MRWLSVSGADEPNGAEVVLAKSGSLEAALVLSARQLEFALRGFDRARSSAVAARTQVFASLSERHSTIATPRKRVSVLTRGMRSMGVDRKTESARASMF